MPAQDQLYMILAVGLTVVGSLGNALGYVWQKKGHLAVIEKNEIRDINGEETITILTNKTWIIGFIVCLIGSILTAFAFTFDAQSVLVLVFNAIFATQILGESFTRKNLYGIILVIIG